MLFFFVLAIGLSAEARVVTAPSTPDQRIINPAVAAFRQYSGVAIDVNRDEESGEVLDLVNSSVKIKTKIESMNVNAAVRKWGIFAEFSASPQKGVKETASNAQTDSGPEFNLNSAKLTIIPLQAQVAVPLGANFAVGLKAMSTSYEFDDSLDLQTVTPRYNEMISQTRQLEGSFLALAPGVVCKLGTSGFALGYVAEFLRVQNNQAIQGTYDRLAVNETGVLETQQADTVSQDTLSIRKDIFGLGYRYDFRGNNNFRIEASYEHMPPPARGEGYNDGELVRGIAEMNLLYFRFGVEATRTQGYYVDSYNLIPYFFNINHLSGDPVQDLAFFGGLKTSKGHGVGAYYSQSSSTVMERLTVGSEKQKIAKKSTVYGLSYSYVF
jgi:hypothetical protein